MSFKLSVDKLKIGLSKTKDNFLSKIRATIGLHKKIDTGLLEELEATLLGSDVGLQSAMQIIDRLKKRALQSGIDDSDTVLGWLKDELRLSLTNGVIEGTGIIQDTAKPYVILIIGVNGTGKTTTIGKLAHRYVQDGKRVLVAASDTFRAGAVEQLSVWARRSRSELVKSKSGADPAAVAFDAVAAARARGIDVVIIDTAGRLHTKYNLMEELKKIKRSITKSLPSAPQEVLLVLDATTGQNGLAQARLFHQAVGVTGVVLSKLDGTAKGGIIIAIARELKLPVKYIGIGEQLDDLGEFDPAQFVEALFA